MTTDPIVAAGLVEREVRSGTRDGAPTKVVVARRTYPADQDELWSVLTDPERLPRWFLPISGDLSVGGRYQLEGNAGGVIERCDPPDAFAVTWEFDSQTSWLEVRLSSSPGGTTLELAHEALLDDFWDQFGPGAAGVGWDLALLGLDMHVDTGEPLDPEEAAGFPLEPDGCAFVQHVAADWAEAAVRGGEDPDAARAAGARTAAFYTGTDGTGSDGT